MNSSPNTPRRSCLVARRCLCQQPSDYSVHHRHTSRQCRLQKTKHKLGKGDWWGAEVEVPATAAVLDFVLSDASQVGLGFCAPR